MNLRVTEFCSGGESRKRESGAGGRFGLREFAVFADRSFTVMTLVLLAMGFAMVGMFLPLTIYYQSVVGLITGDKHDHVRLLTAR